MLSINGPEFIVLVIIALVIIGPERLPQYAQQLGRTVRELRRMAQGAREQVRAELGEEFDDLDWQKLDPRQYDPRRIVKEALSDVWDDEPVRSAPGAAAATAAAKGTAARTGSSAVSTTKGATKPAVNPNQRSSAAPRAKDATASSAKASTSTLTKPAGRPGARPGGGASRPGDTVGPAPFDLEAT